MNERIALISLGCPKNQVDAEAMLARLKKIRQFKRIKFCQNMRFGLRKPHGGTNERKERAGHF